MNEVSKTMLSCIKLRGRNTSGQTGLQAQATKNLLGLGLTKSIITLNKSNFVLLNQEYNNWAQKSLYRHSSAMLQSLGPLTSRVQSLDLNYCSCLAYFRKIAIVIVGIFYSLNLYYDYFNFNFYNRQANVRTIASIAK